MESPTTEKESLPEDTWTLLPDDRPGPAPQHLFAMALLVLLGTLMGTLGTFGLPVGHNVSVFWPAMTLQAVGGLWFGGWGVLGGTLFALLSNLITGGSLANLWGFIPSNIVQSGLCAWAFRYWRLDPSLSTSRAIGAFVIAGCLLSNIIGAGLGVCALYFGGEIKGGHHAILLFISWVIGNAVPCLILGIPLLEAFSPLVVDSPFFCKGWWGGSRRLEASHLHRRDLPVAARLLVGFGVAGVFPIMIVSAVESFSRPQSAGQQPGFILPIMLNLSIFLSLIISGRVARNISRRVNILAEGARFFGQGELHRQIIVDGEDEFGKLARTFNQMAGDLEASREDLRRTTAVRERYEKELEIAYDIQQSFLPQEFPQIPGYDLSALNIPARHVGGDFYDFIPLVDGRWGLAVADVSDKGVPAALFMALSKSLVRAYSLEYRSVLEALTTFNDFVEVDNTSAMFVTLFYATLDPETHQISFINAGHNPPVMLSNKEKTVIMLSARGGAALGIFPGITLEEHSLSMEPGDILVLYTDGITEAFNRDREMFGLERLKAVVESNPSSSAEELLKAVTTAVTEFIGDAPQSDDITLLVLCRDKQ